ncbi:Clavaminate synthase-like protein [Testicularia cyperi]|uniref:Clavaminate synthase-like protein n=1 Tax=Testicularia cyperi TaxID=1882483 RepID=A0A317XGJ3_9BASI|nr:Clavaminate synthase-like protein [Testicularia cyperi]
MRRLQPLVLCCTRVTPACKEVHLTASAGLVSTGCRIHAHIVNSHIPIWSASPFIPASTLLLYTSHTLQALFFANPKPLRNSPPVPRPPHRATCYVLRATCYVLRAPRITTTDRPLGNMSANTAVHSAPTSCDLDINNLVSSTSLDQHMTIDIDEANRQYPSPGAAALKRLAADSDSASNSDGSSSLPSTEPSTTPDEGSSSAGSSSKAKRHKRARTGAHPFSSSQKTARYTQVAHPLGIKPLGNAYVSDRNDRNATLGLFARFDDEFLLAFLALFTHEPETLATLERVSRGLYAFVNATNSIWRDAFLLRFQGRMKRWCGSWKRTFVWHWKLDRAQIDEKAKATFDGSNCAFLDPPSARIQSPYLFSDVLYHPFRLAMAPLEHLVAPSCPFNPITKIDLSKTGSVLEFKEHYAYASRPAILQNAMPVKDWPCREWTIQTLAQRWPNRFFQCEAVKARLPTYFSYSRGMQHLCQQTWLQQQENDREEEVERTRKHSADSVDDDDDDDHDGGAAGARGHSPRSSPPGTPTSEGVLEKQGQLLRQVPRIFNVGPHTFSAAADDGDSTFDPYSVPDESPFYLFDATFSDDPHASLEWRVPKFFQQISATPTDSTSNHDASAVRSDLFSLLGPLRPDNRWIIAGPARSGSGWHKDPNGTSAWNAVLNGRKAWMMLPPHVTPPGVYVSDDEAEVTAPLSIAEWLLDFAEETRRLFGPGAKRAEDRLLLEGVCEEGEVLYVPGGWWHLVINLDESVALTQNFVSPAELGTVLDFMKNKSDQLSGFKKSQVASGGTQPALAPGRQAGSLPTVAKPTGAEAAAEDEECEDGAGFEVFGLFCERLGRFEPQLLESGLARVAELEAERAAACLRQPALLVSQRSKPSAAGKPSRSTWWEQLKSQDHDASSGLNGDSATDTGGCESAALQQEAPSSFSFSCQLGDDELDEVPW